jgi:hemolysin activation/secretion protein
VLLAHPAVRVLSFHCFDRLFCLRFAVCVALFVALQGAQADASTADRATAEQRRVDERARHQRDTLQPRSNETQRPDLPLPALDWPAAEAPCVTIRAVVLDGEASSRFQFALDDILAGPDPAIGRCLGAQGIAVAVERAQRALVERGYVTTRVLVQPQDVASGRLVLSLLPGRVRALRFAPGTSPRATLRNALPMRPGDILNLRDIEQGLENFRRLPSVASEVFIEPADEASASDLRIAWQQAKPWRLNASIDDSGSRATGRYMASLTLSIDHGLTLNDLFYLTFNHDLGGGEPGIRGNNGQTAHYSLPWGYWWLGFTAAHSQYHQNVAGPFENFVYSGTSDQADLSLTRWVRRDGRGKTGMVLKAWARRADTAIDGADVEPQRRATGGWELGLFHSQTMARATLDLQLAHRRGTAAFNARPAPEQNEGEGTSRLRVTTLDIGLQAPWQWAGLRGRAQSTLRAQHNGTALPAPDRFAIGGRYTVRGFDGETSLAGDRGVLLRNELSLSLGAWPHEVYLGLDHGRVGGPSTRWMGARRLTGAVLGLRGRVGASAYDLFFGWPLQRPANVHTASTTAGFSLSTAF